MYSAKAGHLDKLMKYWGSIGEKKTTFDVEIGLFGVGDAMIVSGYAFVDALIFFPSVLNHQGAWVSDRRDGIPTISSHVERN